MQFSFWDFFFHPVLNVTTLAVILLSVFCSLFGCVLYVRRKALLSEAMSHAAYLGVLVGIFLGSYDIFLGVLSAFLGLILLNIFERQFRLSQDVSLSVTLSISLSMGAFLASVFQQNAPVAYKQSLIFLYGQAATLLHWHVVYFSLISIISILFLYAFRRLICWSSLDPTYLRLKNFSLLPLEFFLYLLLSFSVVIGSRACGIMLVSGLMIAPAIFARAFSENFSKMMTICAIVGGVCGFLGVYFSVQVLQIFSLKVSIPTGPFILLVLAFFTLIALLCSPKTGLVRRMYRILGFKWKIYIENTLKDVYKRKNISFVATVCLKFCGLMKDGKLTKRGMARAQNLIRLHRLWELYLAKELKVKGERIHESAEEMEHILDASMERRLTKILNNPLYDPHDNEIPQKVEEND